MTASRQQRATPEHPPLQRGPKPGNGTRATTCAGIATVCSALTLTSVIQGISWIGFVTAATVLIGGTGLSLRALRIPSFLVGLGQLLVLLLFVTSAFMTSGTLGIIPGPAAFGELAGVLNDAAEQIRTNATPIEASTSILCLVTIAIGLVAIVVDTITVTAAAPAVAGLVLLGVYAVPAALSNELLPWWTFVLPAGAFAVLLTVSRHPQRSLPRRIPDTSPAPGLAVALSLTIALITGVSVTAVGTDGTLPGTVSEADDVPADLGISPFTSLRGMLDNESDVELFRVQGMEDERRLLRAFTLDTYLPNEGWNLSDESRLAGDSTNGPLPRAPGDHGEGEDHEIRIEPINWDDVWLPVYGSPREVRNTSSGWHYDPTSGTIDRQHSQQPDPYVEIASLQQPDREALRQASSGNENTDSIYTDASGIDPRVRELTQELVRTKTNDFDRAEAVWRHFHEDGGFVYDTETAPASDHDAIADFLFHSKRGFCEQYASSMAVMLRAVDIPSRVAIGFTEGHQDGEDRVITSQDAHAWVEVYFDDRGWVAFDPTPLSDGRGSVPPYLQNDDDNTGEPTTQQDEAGEPTPETDQTRAAEDGARDTTNQDSDGRTATQSISGLALATLVVVGIAVVTTLLAEILRRRADTEAKRRATPMAAAAGALWGAALLLLSWWLHAAVAVAVLIIMLVAATPLLIREVRRKRRLADITARRPRTTDQAWEELCAECTDRGLEITHRDTVRLAGQKIAQHHLLDSAGTRDLQSLINAMERSWYSPDHVGTEDEVARAFRGVRNSLRRQAPLSWRARLFPRSVLTLFRRSIPRDEHLEPSAG